MKLKSLILIGILLFCILTMSTASASDDNIASNELSISEDSNIETSMEENSLESNIPPDDSLEKTPEPILSSKSTNNFKNLNDLIKKAEKNSEINLTQNYIYNSKTDADFDDGIKINKALTINGQGCEINGKDQKIFKINGDNVTIKNIIFKDAGIYIKGSNCRIINCSFRDCSVNSDGGAIYTKGVNCSVMSCSFHDCSAWWGGAICSDEYISVVDCRFMNCSAWLGGAISSYNSYISDCIFLDCSDRYGGAIYFHETFSLVNSSFTNGAWTTYDYSRGNISNVLVDGVEYDIEAFTNLKGNETVNLTKDYMLLSPIQISANNLIINGKGNSIKGNKITITGKNVTMTNCKFINCRIISKEDNCCLLNCVFMNCTTDEYNGAVYSHGNNCSVVNCTFWNCSDCEGNAIYFDGTFRLVNSSFDGVEYDVDTFNNLKGNETVNLTKDCLIVSPISINVDNLIINGKGNFIKGNKITITGKNVTLINCKFITCLILSEEDDCNIINSSFKECSINTCGSNCSMINCSFQECYIYTSGSNCSIINSSFQNCHGYGYGSVYSSGVNFTIVDCSFMNCYASKTEDDGTHDDHGGYGGAINIWAKNSSIINCSFVNCSATGIAEYIPSKAGAIEVNGKNCLIIDCSFLNCSANKGGAIYSNKAKFRVINCTFINCQDDNMIAIDIQNMNYNILNCTFINCFMKAKIIASNTKMYYNDGSYFKVRVCQYDGNPAAGAKVVLKIDGKKFKTLQTDKKGYVKVKITKPPKTYKITITALGTTVTKKLTVKKVLSLEKATVEKSAGKLTLTSTLKQGKTPLENKQVTFKFNGKKYTAKTDKKGIAKVTIKKSDLSKLKVGKKVKYSATYIKDTVKRTAKIE